MSYHPGVGAGQGGPVSWDSVQNKPARFPPQIPINPVDIGGTGKEPTKILRGDGTWVDLPSGGVVDWVDVQNKPAAFPPEAHNHDDLYPTETELAVALSAKSDVGHSHAISNVTGLQAALDAKQPAGSYAAASHTHAQSEVTNLVSDLAGKAATSHTHTASQISDSTATGRSLMTAADAAAARTATGAAAASHTHNASDINAGTMATGRLGSGTADATTFLRGDQTWATPAGGSGAAPVAHMDYFWNATNVIATNATGTWEFPLNLATDAKYRRQVDWTNATQGRITAIQNAAGVAGELLEIQYSTNITTPSWVDTGLTVALNTAADANGRQITGAYGSIPVGARGLVLIRVVVKAGNGVADPSFFGIGIDWKA